MRIKLTEKQRLRLGLKRRFIVRPVNILEDMAESILSVPGGRVLARHLCLTSKQLSKQFRSPR